ASFGDCNDLAQGGVDLLQDILDEVSALSMDEFLEGASTGEDPAFVTKFEGRADSLDAAQTELGCSDNELAAYLRDHVAELEGSGPVGELMVQAIQQDPDSFLE
ncbi:MAG: hypothetical protein OES13_11165, partial [Acidimicrobiia bacterium]|nr:hypothetical protein [Acidimicrobiia bacterium]